jgi:hypothetical protein
VSDMKDFAIFALKVAAVVLVINQIPAVSKVINTNYFAKA